MTARRFAGPRARTALLVSLPLAVAALGALVTVAVPSSLVHGNAQTGPRGFATVRTVRLDYQPTVAWGTGRKSLMLLAHPRGSCRVQVLGTSSTAPGRVEVHAVETGSPCSGSRALERIPLPLPVILDPHGGVHVQIGAETLHLPGGRRGVPHPKGVLNAD